MDSLRSTLMLLCVVLHSCRVFDTAQAWVIHADHTSIVADYLGGFVAVFMLPTFFVISGYFSILALKKNDLKKFAGSRMLRIGLPLLMTAITLNSIQAFFLDWSGFQQYRLGEYLAKGEWVSHLWFLVNLMVYFGITIMLAALLKDSVQKVARWARAVFSAIPLPVILLAMPMFTLASFGLNTLGIHLNVKVLGVFDLLGLLIYFPYYALGCVLGDEASALNKFIKFRPVLLFFGLLCAVSIMKISSSFNGIVPRLIAVYLAALINWLAVVLCFCLFHRFFNRPSNTWRFLSDASYTVYLFHHVIVIAIGFFLIRLSLPAVPSLLFLISATFAITILIYRYFVSRWKPARFLFNGK